MSITKIDKSPNEVELRVTIDKEQYGPKWQTEVKKLQQKAQLKGFRKGKVPTGVIRKMYGRDLLADVVNKLLVDELDVYMKSEHFKPLGQPIPKVERDEVIFDIDAEKTYEFAFEVGIEPVFELQGADAQSTFTRYLALIDDEKVDQEWEALLEAKRDLVDLTEGPFEANDRLKLSIKEYDNGQIKEGGHDSAFSILLGDVDEDKLKEELTNAPIGHEFLYNPYKLEHNLSEEHVRKYVLGISEEEAAGLSETFLHTLTGATRPVRPAVNQELFDSVFGPDQVRDEAGAKALIRDHMERQYARHTESILLDAIRQHLIEVNQLELPRDYVHRMMQWDKDGEVTDQEVEDRLKALKWDVIVSELVGKFEVHYDDQELSQYIVRTTVEMFEQYGLSREYLDNYLRKVMSEHSMVHKKNAEYRELKALRATVEAVTIHDQYVSIAELMGKVHAQEEEE